MIKHQCDGQIRDYIRGTPAGFRGRCPNTAKVKRDGEWYCGIHDPVKIKEREERRDLKAKKQQEEIENMMTRTWGFRVDGLRIYEIQAKSEEKAKARLVDLIVEVKIEPLGELNEVKK